MKMKHFEMILGIALGWFSWGCLSAGNWGMGAAAGLFALTFICGGIVRK